MPQSVPAFLKALGNRPLPERIDIRERSYRLARVFKNDFFAVTALYESQDHRVLVKIGRQARFFGLPLKWVGRWLTHRECAMLEVLHDVEGVPQLIERYGPTGLVREFIEGHALAKGESVADDFHLRLRSLIETIHARGMAYVDLEKCENVLVGDDGKPYLFDFQISWYLPKKWGGELPPMRIIRSRLQCSDLYHLLKLQRRTRPDQLTPKQLQTSYQKPWYIRAHTLITRPLTLTRRWILNKIDPRKKRGERGRVHDPSTTKLHN